MTDDGDYAAFRYGPWKISFLTQECTGFAVWDCQYKVHRAPRIANLRQDPFEHAQRVPNSWNYEEWMFRRAYLFVPAQGFVGKFVKSNAIVYASGLQTIGIGAGQDHGQDDAENDGLEGQLGQRRGRGSRHRGHRRPGRNAGAKARRSAGRVRRKVHSLRLKKEL